MNNLNLPDVNYHLNSATIKNRTSTIPRMLDSGANIIEIHPEDSMTMMPTHTPLQASTATGALMESTAEARITFQHKLKSVPQQMFQGHVLPSLARHTVVRLGREHMFLEHLLWDILQLVLEIQPCFLCAFHQGTCCR